MNLFIPRIIAVAFTSLFLYACAVAPSSPPGAAEVRNKLSALQHDPKLAERARVELQEAEEAVRLAEQPLYENEADVGEYRVYMADRKVEIARAKATRDYAEGQRTRFAEERDAARLAARTQEADRARIDADQARDEASRARSAAAAARLSEADASAEATQRATELQRQIDALEAKATERGLVITLGDLLFATGSAQLQGGASNRLNKLVNFLNQYPDRRVLIEGHTDSVGSAASNQDLS